MRRIFLVLALAGCSQTAAVVSGAAAGFSDGLNSSDGVCRSSSACHQGETCVIPRGQSTGTCNRLR